MNKKLTPEARAVNIALIFIHVENVTDKQQHWVSWRSLFMHCKIQFKLEVYEA